MENNAVKLVFHCKSLQNSSRRTSMESLLLRGSSEASDAAVGNGPISVKGQVPVGSKRTQDTLSLTAGRNTFQLAQQIPTVSSNHSKLRVVSSLKKEPCECVRRGRCPCSREDQVRGASCDVLRCACDVMFTLGSRAWSRSVVTMSDLDVVCVRINTQQLAPGDNFTIL